MAMGIYQLHSKCSGKNRQKNDIFTEKTQLDQSDLIDQHKHTEW
jgi:hypothetical protein